MKVLVCIKQVYMSGTDMTIDTNTSWVHYKPGGFRINGYDEYALEEALLIKECTDKTEVHALSVGPARVEAAVKRAMEMGADEGIHVRHDKEGYVSPYHAASLVAAYAKDKHYDIILTGVMAEDDMQMQTGQMIAGMLDYPYATSVMYQKMATGQSLYVERECDNRSRECIELSMPCVLSIQSGINKPRYPSLSNILRARQQKIIEVPAKDFDASENREKVIRIFIPELKPKGVFLQGSQREKAAELLRILHEKVFI